MAREQLLIAKDFLGLGNTVDAPRRDDAEWRPSGFLDLRINSLPRKLNENIMSGLGPPTTFLKNGSFLSSVAASGTCHSVWSKAANQQLVPNKNSNEDRFVEQSAESVPEKLFPQFVHPVQTWIKSPSQRHDNHGGPSMNMSSGYGETNQTLTIADMNGAGHVSEALQKRFLGTRHPEKLGGAPLTIFYGGNVNVFNDVSEEKAKVIMFLAGGGTFQGKANCPVASIQSGFGNTNVRLDFDHFNVAAPGSPGQPVVPRALPQARKASLARFLEKRKERIQSKSPYVVKQTDSSSPEERFSSSNDVAAYELCKDANDKQQVAMPNWTERTFEHSPCDMVVKEEIEIVAA